ncbi:MULTISPECIES: dihydrolipoyllysine-residue acetyltransferase [unclassified Colwellia]|uniref:dihydrolipoyllysine-residue acetyltransferase n=1 Tax=unclassified Colwellia TaxID=196834 RepID=UPI0015F6B20D|nr:MULTISPECIES: dihydrolipoyllysine-residue acetyltransferase [unclassified Colwellia]MBA6233061.1 dihydrolipoyllysine-residue acetyltransferase [Colwellia sp. MB02u-7]MBA6236739.1 dihydrolipoyllysine-residue acetyltransferase [Colwellia sp. MB02u-11]MBA6255931.1 dihydrolipoyllysine-residue acetyltransferase [Colwellia sp. MB3u-28]MBA6262073.1 dihydrolipoyllysine-residue acetyltransferase [Colwellia sp. MB3u-41]MBA6299148.1 dihydrolipoyllysine-residue acetyltransferase [Colwellia sp. MB3u-22]
MSIDFILPDIGEGIVECELVEWLVKEGDVIVEDQPIADVMTDKALVQIPAMHNGTVTKLYYAQGDIAKVHKPLFSMITDQEPSVEQPASVPEIENTARAEHPVAAADVVAATFEREDFILPDIGEGIVECELVEWLVKEGDVIVEDQPIADVMTDKALVQIPAMHNGTVTKLYYAKGEIAKVHAPLFEIEKRSVNTNEPAAVAVKSVETPTVSVAKEVAVSNINVEKKVVNSKAVASPAVRRVARELNVNIHEIPGSGKKGRVYKEDVVSFTKVPVVSTENVTQVAAVAQSGGKRVEPIRGIKAAMAKAMVRSVSTIPHFTYCEEIDMTNLMALRSGMKDAYAKQDIKLTMMPFFMKSISLALKEFPIVNTQVNDDCTEITYFDDHNIGMAVDSKVGLLVPNVKQVQNKSIVDVAKDIMRLTDSARAGRVGAEDLKGGTITISNIGAIGGTVATPIINKPESAIVALGKLQKLPRFNDKGEVEARYIMQVSWSGDHRVIDGGSIARFCNLWKSFLEEPSNMLMHMS